MIDLATMTATELHLTRVLVRRVRAWNCWRLLRAHPTKAMRAWGWVVGWDRACHEAARTSTIDAQVKAHRALPLAPWEVQ